jgi:hypothetical protein
MGNWKDVFIHIAASLKSRSHCIFHPRKTLLRKKFKIFVIYSRFCSYIDGGRRSDGDEVAAAAAVNESAYFDDDRQTPEEIEFQKKIWNGRSYILSST